MTYKSIGEWVYLAVNTQRHIEVASASDVDIVKVISDFEAALSGFKTFEIDQAFIKYIRRWPFMPRPRDIHLLCEIERLKDFFVAENAERSLLDDARSQRAN